MSKQESIKFSIIIPAYNVAAYIEKCVRSIAEQTYSNKEIIVVNDGSKDTTGDILAQLSLSFPCVKVITQKNQGLCISRNNGYAEATGDYIIFVDGDDWHDADSLNDLSESLSETPVDVLYFGYNNVFKHKIKQRLLGPKAEKVVRGDGIKELELFALNCLPIISHLTYICAWTGCYKKSLLDKYNIINDPRLKVNEDRFFNTCCLKHAESVNYLDKAIYNYRRVVPTSLMHIGRREIVGQHQEYLDILKDYIQKYHPSDEKFKESFEINAWLSYFCVLFVGKRVGKEYQAAIYSELEASPELQRASRRFLVPGPDRYHPFLMLVSLYVRIWYAFRRRIYKVN